MFWRVLLAALLCLSIWTTDRLTACSAHGTPASRASCDVDTATGADTSRQAHEPLLIGATAREAGGWSQLQQVAVVAPAFRHLVAALRERAPGLLAFGTIDPTFATFPF